MASFKKTGNEKSPLSDTVRCKEVIVVSAAGRGFRLLLRKKNEISIGCEW